MTNKFFPFTHFNEAEFKENNKENQERFFGCLLVSQLETVEAVSTLDKQLYNYIFKTSELENSVKYLSDRCHTLENTISDLKNLFLDEKAKNIERFASQSNYFGINYSRHNQSAEIDKDSSDLLSLVDVCSKIHEREESSNNQITTVQKESNSTRTMRIMNYYQHRSCIKVAEQELVPYRSSESRNLKVESKNQSRQLLAIEIGEDQEKSNNKELQRRFNKRVKYEVNRKFGSSYLADHQVRELDVKEMHRIRNKVVRLFKPFPFTIKSAWNNAMNSLRQDRHQLKKRRKYLTL